MAIRVLPKRTSTSVRRVAAILGAQRRRPLVAEWRYSLACLFAFGLVMTLFFAGLSWIQDNDRKAAAACYDRAQAAYVQGSYIAGQLTTLCLQYMSSSNDLPKLQPLGVAGF